MNLDIYFFKAFHFTNAELVSEGALFASTITIWLKFQFNYYITNSDFVNKSTCKYDHNTPVKLVNQNRLKGYSPISCAFEKKYLQLQTTSKVKHLKNKLKICGDVVPVHELYYEIILFSTNFQDLQLYYLNLVGL